jgi:phage shock protein E
MITTVQALLPHQYQQQFAATQQRHLLLDVRLPDEFAQEHLAGAVNIPVQVLHERLTEVPADRPVVFYCRSGNRTKKAAEILMQAGYQALYDLGGIIQWKEQGLPVVR